MFTSRFHRSSISFHNISKVSILLLTLLSGLSGCNSPYSSLTWMTTPRQVVHVLVPDGYEGPVLIAWQIPDGRVAEAKDGALIYRLQKDGALLLKDEPPQGIGNWYFEYEMADGQLIPIPQSTCFDDAPDQGVVVCTGMMAASTNKEKVRPNVSYAITTIANKRQAIDAIFSELYPDYKDRLVIPGQGGPP